MRLPLLIFAPLPQVVAANLVGATLAILLAVFFVYLQ